MTTIIIAVLALVALAAIFGAILGFASIKFKVEADPIVEQIDAILPQTQCGQCGYPGCKPYATAIANGDAINKCPPGGQATIEKLADLMGVEVESSAHDAEKSIKKVAFIHEDMCIGCTKCIQACPVDAIVGGTKALHTVIKDECTGCDLCVAPCPTDCIEMIPVQTTTDSWKWQLQSIPVVNVTDSNTQPIKS
ncbi:electron transport complex subunit RsxB [Vibrio sp. 10N.286.49.C2]|uniref:electron transport complex subunit RsxB n=1 Tax=unclassified Vibrio TaxID=2614977 RepID=UPI000C867475|nr:MULTISPECIES: electron transport complex subunit RsxB [unclassified Vibrio]PMH28747.1 electron transport complex subunit RsxB [Vibrio sp. 10N.286.49.C2]PMH50900.1 electron transport complex subunit RsxB [Vibrio sp. 10N.286.49.B1]PMH83378.1 electron transport complex subunit RsxB [Vibrio sp. 10N.286.48.B7]